MAVQHERHNPGFVLWPVNNDRTAWRSFGLPVILVVPHARDAGGRPIKNSSTLHVSVSIEGAPDEALVAGHDHVGVRFPDRELFRRTLSIEEVLDRQINTDLLDFETLDGELIADRADVKTGDIMRYTTASGVFDKLSFLEDADYFDLSDILIETEGLQPHRYNLIYTCDFYVRVIATDIALGVDELICIDINKRGQGTLRFGLNHPGEVMLEFYRLTPPVYLTNALKSQDTTVAFYRAFTDALQDVYDEQKFIKTINWVDSIPYEAIPYLSQLLGWDVPYFPESLDQLRRLILRKTRELQQLKGSRRAIRELMSLFGFTILFKNLWYSVDGSRFIAPGEHLPSSYAGQEIEYVEKFQVEPVLSSYQKGGFGDVGTFLMFRPQKISGLDPFTAPDDSADLTVDAYLVTAGSPADLALKNQVALMEADPEEYGAGASCVQDEIGFISIGQMDTALAGLDIVGHSQILVRGGFGIDQTIAGIEPPFRVVGPPLLGGVSYDKEENAIRLIFDHYLDFTGDNTTIYVFASYKRQEVKVPAALTNLRSNRFGIQILARNGGDIRPDVLEFVLDFIHKIKAFHSLLDSIQYRVELTETYLVTDMCAGGDVTQRYDVAIGRQQVPPAIIPNVPGENCSEMTPEGLGYKPADIIYRRLLLGALLEEFAAWKALDSRESVDSVLLRLIAAAPAPGRDACKYNQLGQDRVVGDRSVEADVQFDPSPNAGEDSALDRLSPYDRAVSGVGQGAEANVDGPNPAYSSMNREHDGGQEPWCDLDAKTDYCYKGRAEDEVLLRLSPSLTEIRRNLACGLPLGAGVYWTYPTLSKRSTAGVKQPAANSRTRRSVYTGSATDVYQTPLNDGPAGENLTIDPGAPLDRAFNSKLGRLYRSYGQPLGESIHYSDRDYLIDHKQSQWLALERPSLEIQQSTLHFPGCRFPMLGKLKNDYISDDWTARPWDDIYSSDDLPCNGTPSWLNARLVTDTTTGNERLVFDNVPFKVLGNGLDADISGLGSHDVPSGQIAEDIVHAIYSSQSTGHPAITLDDMDDCGTPGDVIVVDRPLFPSAVPLATGGWQDYCDGYPSQYGYFDFSDLDLGNDGLYQDLYEALGVPGIEFDGSNGTNSVSLLFYLGSGIRDGSMGVRLDCGCQLAGAAETEDQRMPCATDLYLDENGDYDFSGDQLSIQRILLADEEAGVGPYMLDGSIPSLMELIIP